VQTFILAFVGTTLMFGSFHNVVHAVQNVTVGQQVAADQQVSMDQVDHSRWNQLVKKYVDQDGGVNYKSWKSSAADVQQLDSYLNTLSTASRQTNASRAAQLAFWINAYNAVTVKGILREYPTSSIRNHTARLLGYNIWKNLLLIVGDSKISLDDMEHQVLRKMGEPRIHFSIVCASNSCPRLLNEAYDPSRLEEQLTANSKHFFANPENFKHDVNGRRFQLSSIMSWFGNDFGSDQAAQLKSIAPYLPTTEAYNAAMNNSVDVSYLDYDWGLNEQKIQGSSRR
jgi:hypothetical protein